MNQNISYYNCERRVIKWWKKIFFAGIEFACSNAKIIFEKFNNKKLSDLEFKSILISELCEDIGANTDENIEKINDSKYISINSMIFQN